jgi:hypothetical protein
VPVMCGASPAVGHWTSDWACHWGRPSEAEHAGQAP